MDATNVVRLAARERLAVALETERRAYTVSSESSDLIPSAGSGGISTTSGSAVGLSVWCYQRRDQSPALLRGRAIAGRRHVRQELRRLVERGARGAERLAAALIGRLKAHLVPGVAEPPVGVGPGAAPATLGELLAPGPS